jgi:hypothetical protein
MSKLLLTSLGAAGVATAVPVMHFVGKRQQARPVVVHASSMALFMMGWALVGTGLSQPPPGTKDSLPPNWRARQLVLSFVGVGMVVMGAGLVQNRAKFKLPLSVGSAVFVGGWAIVTAAVALSDPDYHVMSAIEKSGRVTQALTSTLTIVAGASLISMSDGGMLSSAARSAGVVPLSRRTLEAVGGVTFALGWVGLVATSAMQD